MKRGVVWSVAFCLAAWGAPAWAQLSNDVVKIGVATDMASLYSDINGPGAVVAAQMAIDDFGGTILGKKIELLTGDIQNKADVAATLAGRWYDSENVDVILGAGASSSSIALMGVAVEKKRVYLATDPASSDLTARLWDLDAGKQVRILAEHRDIVWTVAFSPDGRTALTGGGMQHVPGIGFTAGARDYDIRVVDVESGTSVETAVEASSAPVFSGDGRSVFVRDAPSRLGIFDIARGEMRWITERLARVQVSRAGHRAAFAEKGDFALRLVDAESGDVVDLGPLDADGSFEFGPGGHVLLWPCRTKVSRAPLFMHPGGERVMGWGVLPGVPPAYLDEALARLDMLSELTIACGGKRYLSGYITFDAPERWAAHFGEKWETILSAKKRYDPDRILNPGFVRYP